MKMNFISKLVTLCVWSIEFWWSQALLACCPVKSVQRNYIEVQSVTSLQVNCLLWVSLRRLSLELAFFSNCIWSCLRFWNLRDHWISFPHLQSLFLRVPTKDKSLFLTTRLIILSAMHAIWKFINFSENVFNRKEI